MTTVQLGVNLNQIINADYDTQNVDAMRSLYRAIDFFAGGARVLNTTITDPSTIIAPANFDSYFCPAGAVAPWEDNTFYVWRVGVTSGVNNMLVSPFWEAYTPPTLCLITSFNDGYVYMFQMGSLHLYPFDQLCNTTDPVQFESTATGAEKLIYQPWVAGYQFLTNDINSIDIGLTGTLENGNELVHFDFTPCTTIHFRCSAGSCIFTATKFSGVVYSVNDLAGEVDFAVDGGKSGYFIWANTHGGSYEFWCTIETI